MIRHLIESIFGFQRMQSVTPYLLLQHGSQIFQLKLIQLLVCKLNYFLSTLLFSHRNSITIFSANVTCIRPGKCYAVFEKICWELCVYLLLQIKFVL
jgi:hypothetical protein